MDRIVITIRPPSSDDQLLRVEDAMQQVIDTMKLLAQAEQAMASPHEAFEWRLERASTNSPFTVVALAEARNPTVDVSAHVERVKAEVSRAVTDLVKRHIPAPWMGQDAVRLVRGVFARNLNGIGRTDIDFETGAPAISIDRGFADEGLRSIEGMNPTENLLLDERISFGEIEGVMVAAGRYRNQLAIQLKTELYGFVWCTLSKALAAEFGSGHVIKEVWEGKTIGVEGRLFYMAGGLRLAKIEAQQIREIAAVERVDLDSVLDPDFTSGLDPHEYLRKLHQGELA